MTNPYSNMAEWRIVALSSEVGEAPVGVKVAGGEYVLFRDAEGACRALIDRCAHRRAPLSLGHVVNGLIQCPYHGWAFDGVSGACRAIPNLGARQTIPKPYRVDAYRVHEADGFVFLSVTGEGSAAIGDAPLRDASREGRAVLAYPASLFIDTLLDSPSALIDIDGVAIMDDHGLGDPRIVDGMIVATYAACPRRLMKKDKVLADFPLNLEIRAPLQAGAVHLTLRDAAGSVKGRLAIAPCERDDRLTDLIWRAASNETGTILSPRTAPDTAAIVASKRYVSAVRKAAAPAYNIAQAA